MDYNITYFEKCGDYCPSIPSKAAYIHILHDLINLETKSE